MPTPSSIHTLKVELRTADDHFVVQGGLPPFSPPPEVLGWGNRVFRYERKDDNGDGSPRHVYRECMGYALVDGFTWSEGI